MKTKLMRKISMLLAICIFMTQVSYFPVKAAEAFAEEIDEAGTAAETSEICMETETASSTYMETEMITETGTTAETAILTEDESGVESLETEAVAETVLESSSYLETGSETETETTTAIETEPETELETESTEEQFDNGNVSLSGNSFYFSDIRDASETDSKELNTDDGKQAVYVFGSFTTCSNTAAAVTALSKCVTYYDMNEINMFVFDISDVGSKNKQALISWLTNNEISEDVTVSSIYSSMQVRYFYYTCFDEVLGDTNTFTMPLIVYKGTNGEVYKYTTGYQTENSICESIELGGLSKITEPEGEKEGLLYVVSGVKYNMAYEILDLVNAERAKEGLPALVMDKDLLDAAMQRAVECEVYYASDHTRPNGEKCYTASDKMNGENIAWGFGSAKQVMDAWMNSPGHRANILREEFHSIGIGVADAGGRLAFTQCFGVGEAEALQKPSDIASKIYEVRYIKSRIAPSLKQSSVNLAQGKTHVIVIRTQNTPVESYLDEIMGDSYTWKSSDETVAVVDELGIVKGVKPGKATITGTNILNKEHTLTLEVTVEETKPNVSSVTLNETSLQLKVNETFHLTATVKANISIDQVEWSSSDETVATVNEDGLVTAKSEGTAVITAASYGKTATCKVKVEQETEPKKSFTVTFDPDGGSAVEALTVYENDTADEPDQPVKTGYNFAGWQLDGKPYDFSTPVTASITLKATWKEYETLEEPAANLKSETKLESGTRVALSHKITDVTIYYTTNGSTPTVNSTEYKNAIVVDKEMTIKAIAVKEGYKDSQIASFHYTVAEKGSLWGDVSPEDVPDNSIPKGIWVTGIQDATYTGKAITHNIRVYDGSTLLVEKRDYTISYKNNVKAAKTSDAKAPTVIISGKGNYSEKKAIAFNIHPKNINDRDVNADEMTLAYTGKANKAVPVITYNQKKLANNKDFTVIDPAEYSEARRYTIKVEGKGNYTGTRNIMLTVTEKTLINKASVAKIPNQIHDGKDKTPEITVKLKTELVFNEDYTLSYENNRAIGMASVIIRGKGEYAGTKRVNFSIVSPYKGGKYDIGQDEEKLVDVDIDHNTAFLKGGSMPAVRVSFDGKRLVQGKDYTVSYKDNKAAYTVSQKDATVIITGKGNYCGKITKSFQIETKDISETILVINDKVYTGKAKGHLTKLILTDTDGKAMKAGTDYEKEVVYTYANAIKLEDGENREAGEIVKDTDIIPAGTTIRVTVRGTGSYTGSITGEYRVIAKENDISKAKITLKTPQYYTGGRVEPDEKQFEVKLGEKTLQANDYTIVGYTNNIKKGNASVTIRGEGWYGGTKTVKFAISSKTVGTIEVK